MKYFTLIKVEFQKRLWNDKSISWQMIRKRVGKLVPIVVATPSPRRRYTLPFVRVRWSIMLACADPERDPLGPASLNFHRPYFESVSDKEISECRPLPKVRSQKTPDCIFSFWKLLVTVWSLFYHGRFRFLQIRNDREMGLWYDRLLIYFEAIVYDYIMT